VLREIDILSKQFFGGFKPFSVVETSYLTTDMRKFESSQKEEIIAQVAESSKPRAFNTVCFVNKSAALVNKTTALKTFFAQLTAAGQNNGNPQLRCDYHNYVSRQFYRQF